jgi:hypothetical protein
LIARAPSTRKEREFAHYMDAIQLHLALLESGNLLILAQERRASGAGRGSHPARARVRRARWVVERAVEKYVIALRSYRLALVAEFVPAEAAASGDPVRGTKNRARSRATGTSRNRGGHTAQNPAIGGPGFRPRRSSNLQ